MKKDINPKGNVNETLSKAEAFKEQTESKAVRRFSQYDTELRRKLESNKAVSSIIFYGIKEGHFAGGLTGDIEVIVEALVNGMKRDPNLLIIFSTITKVFEAEQAKEEVVQKIDERQTHHNMGVVNSFIEHCKIEGIKISEDAYEEAFESFFGA